MAKRVHTGAVTRKHACSRCKKHRSKVKVLKKKTGRKYTLCDECLERGRK